MQLSTREANIQVVEQNVHFETCQVLFADREQVHYELQCPVF